MFFFFLNSLLLVLLHVFLIFQLKFMNFHFNFTKDNSNILSEVEETAEELRDQYLHKEFIDKIDENINSSISQLNKEISENLQFNKQHQTYISKLETECSDLENEYVDLKNQILASAFIEVPQSLNLSKEPFSTSVENVNEATNKIIYFRILSYLYSQKELLQLNIEELNRLQSQTFCLNDGFHEDFLIDNDLKLQNDDIHAFEYLKDQLLSSDNETNHYQIPYQINAQHEINKTFSDAINEQIQQQEEIDPNIDYDKIPENLQNREEQNKITNITNNFNQIEKDCVDLINSFNFKEINENISSKIEEMEQIEDIRNSIPQELLDKLQTISRNGIQQSLQILSDISTTKEIIAISQNVIN